MTRRQKFKELRINGYTLKTITNFINNSLKATKRWNKEFKNNTLVRAHKLTGKTHNFKSNIDINKIRDEYHESMKVITKDGKARPYNFKYYTEYKMIDTCSLSTFKTIMKGNLIASPWANKNTKKVYIKILKERKKQVSKNNINSKEVIKKIDEIIDLNSKIYFRKSRSEHEGLIGEVDASKDYWLGIRQSHLYVLYEPAKKN